MRALLVVFGLAAGIVSTPSEGFGQDCKTYYFMNQGTEVEMTIYDRKGEASGRSVMRVNEVKGGNEAHLSNTFFNAKGKEQMSTAAVTVRCNNGVYAVDLRNMVSPEMMSGMMGTDVRVTGDMAEYPTPMQPGMTLKDATMTAEPTNGGAALLTMTFTLKNRKVESKESVTTPAGTFECYKITYDASLRSIIGVNFKTTEWFAPGFGIVKTESSRNGKLAGSTLITKVTKGS